MSLLVLRNRLKNEERFKNKICVHVYELLIDMYKCDMLTMHMGGGEGERIND